MSAPAAVLTLGCDPQVQVNVIEDDGALVLQVLALTPEVTDIDALFFDIADDIDVSLIANFPAEGDLPLTGFDVSPDALDQTSNGTQVNEAYDARVEFGQTAGSTEGDVDFGGFTIWLEGEEPLSASDLDLTNMTAVVNTDTEQGVTLSGGVDGPTGGGDTEVTFFEDFEDGFGDLVEDSGKWFVNADGAAETNGCRDGKLELAEVDTDGPVEMSLDVQGVNLDEWENCGRYADKIKVQVQVDDGRWQTLDVFRVNDEGTALEGSETGQVIGEDWGQISYSGGVLDNAEDSVQFRLVSDISAKNEGFRIDNVAVTATEEGACGDSHSDPDPEPDPDPDCGDHGHHDRDDNRGDDRDDDGRGDDDRDDDDRDDDGRDDDGRDDDGGRGHGKHGRHHDDNDNCGWFKHIMLPQHSDQDDHCDHKSRDDDDDDDDQGHSGWGHQGGWGWWGWC